MVQGNLLILILVVSVALLILLISKVKLHAFVSLLLAALFMGILAGMPPVDVVTNITTGFGNTCASIGIIIALGAIIGIFLEKSGAAYTMADTVLKVVGEKRPALAISIIGYIVSIPVFCDSGFIILSALNKSLVRRTKVSMVTMAVALSTGLYATHTLVPPTPGPIAAAANLQADLGMVILLGLVVAAFSAAVGYLWAVYCCKDMHADAFETEGDDLETVIAKQKNLPSPFMSFAPIFLPIILIGLRSLVMYPTIKGAMGETSFLYQLLFFIGNPVIALFLGFLVSLFLLPKFNEETLTNWIGEATKSAGSIILITAAGGALGMIISKTNIGKQLGDALSVYNLGIFLPFVIAAALKTAQGSSTVALTTASSIVFPLLGTLGLATPTGAVLATLAVGSGAMAVSHANDSYFWVVSQFSGMKVGVAYRSHTVATLLQGIVGIIVVYFLSLILI